MNGVPQAEENASSRVLLLVTTPRDAEITLRLLGEAGMTGHACGNVGVLAREIARGAAALLMTEETVSLAGIEVLIRLLHPANDGLDLPTVVLTHGGPRSAVANALLGRLQNLTILERPAPVSSILSATRAAVKVRMRQRELLLQMARIRDLQSQLTAAVEASGLGTFRCEIPLGKIEWNDECKRHFWLPPEAAVDMDRFYSLLHPDDRERTREAVEACVTRGVRYDVEYRTVSPRGEIRWIRATGQTQRASAGAPLFFSGTTQDISVRKEFDAERAQLLESERAARVEGERANQLKDEFLATLGHELRTPLNSIMGWVELLKLEPANPAMIAEGIEVIERNLWAQAQLIDDLLDVSRIISGKVRLDLKPLRLGEVLKASLDTVMPTALAKGVRLESAVAPDLPPVSGDFGRLQQVVWNILTNAVKFTPAGGTVQVRLESRAGALEITISDTGEGIDPDFLPHIFERFRQADGSPSRQHAGLGLGLSIVKTLVEMHGGQIAARSDGVGRGSTFQVRIPIHPSRTEATDEATPATPARFGAAVGERPDLSDIRILVVDDEADARRMMHRLLENCQATSMGAANAAEAERALAEFSPHLILSDIGMPGTDGYQFIRAVRRNGVTTPAVALTAFARPEDRVRSIQAGFQAHLAKPLDPAELLRLVATLVGRTAGNPAGASKRG